MKTNYGLLQTHELGQSLLLLEFHFLQQHAQQQNISQYKLADLFGIFGMVYFYPYQRLLNLHHVNLSYYVPLIVLSLDRHHLGQVARPVGIQSPEEREPVDEVLHRVRCVSRGVRILSNYALKEVALSS